MNWRQFRLSSEASSKPSVIVRLLIGTYIKHESHLKFNRQTDFTIRSVREKIVNVIELYCERYCVIFYFSKRF